MEKEKEYEYFVYLNGQRLGQCNPETTIEEISIRKFIKREYEGPNLIITDQRDIDEIQRRKENKSFSLSIDELYTYNPDFNGKYSY